MIFPRLSCVLHHQPLASQSREIHPLEPQRHRHSMLAPRVCAPRVTRCSLGHVIWSVQLACSILSRSDSCQGDGRQRCMHSARSRSTHLRSELVPSMVTLMLRVANLANTKMPQKNWKMTETLAHGYSSWVLTESFPTNPSGFKLFSKISTSSCFGWK